MRERVLGAFGRWLTQHPVDGYDHGDVFDVVHTACELKASVLDEPNPADSSPISLRDVIREVFPAKTVGVDEHYARTIVPAMLGYVTSSSTRAAGNLRKTCSGVGSRCGVCPKEGIGPADPAVFSAFVERFNDMPYERRHNFPLVRPV